jgi:hypothetical protein
MKADEAPIAQTDPETSFASGCAFYFSGLVVANQI